MELCCMLARVFSGFCGKERTLKTIFGMFYVVDRRLK